MTVFKASLSGQVRQTVLHKWRPLLPLFEAVMNAIQAGQDAGSPDSTITIDIERDHGLGLDDLPPVSAFSVSDSGIGFNDANFDSFNTAFSEYKVTRGGKGLGRFIWLKAFQHVEIDSVFTEPDADGMLRRKFRFDLNYDPDDALPNATESTSTGTTLKMVGYREPYRTECPRKSEQIAQRLIEHFLLLFLQPRPPRLVINDLGVKISVNDVFESEFKKNSSHHVFSIDEHKFALHGFRLTAPRASRHKLSFAANDRSVVSDNLEDYIPNLSGRLIDKEGASFVYLAIVQGDYLNERVNNTRTDFNIVSSADAEVEQPNLFSDQIKKSDIRDKSLFHVSDDLADVISSLNAAKAERIERYVKDEAPHYRVLLKRKDDFIDKISPNVSRADLEAALHRELHQREVDLKKEGNRIITDAARLNNYEDYHHKLSQFMEDYNELGVSALGSVDI